MIICNYVTGGLKAQKHLAQGTALGLVSEFFALQGQKLQYRGNAFAPTGRNYHLPST